MNLVIQGKDVETTALKELAKLACARGIEQVAPNVFRLTGASPAEGVAELCADQNLQWRFEPDE